MVLTLPVTTEDLMLALVQCDGIEWPSSMLHDPASLKWMA